MPRHGWKPRQIQIIIGAVLLRRRTGRNWRPPPLKDPEREFTFPPIPAPRGRPVALALKTGKPLPLRPTEPGWRQWTAPFTFPQMADPTWNEPIEAPDNEPIPGDFIASSADGSKLLTAQYSGYVRISTNSGTTWFLGTNMMGEWSSITCSADGSKMAVQADGDGQVPIVSTNCGITWKRAARTIAQGGSLVLTATGDKLMLLTSANCYLSTNWGATWSSTNSNPVFGAAVCSANGSTVLGRVNGQPANLYASTNFGVTWTSNNVSPEAWTALASSADGNKLVAVATSTGGFIGGIWVLQTPPSPRLNLSSSNGELNFSWLVPSTNMALQQSSDLINWTTLTNSPSLNWANLEEQLILSPGNSSSFFQLISQ